MTKLLTITDDFYLFSHLISDAHKFTSHFHDIFSDENVETTQLLNLYYIINASKVDHKLFVVHALNNLNHKDLVVRVSSARFIGKHGIAADAPPLVALLCDSRLEAAWAAAEALSMIGDERAVVAFDVWLRTSRNFEEDLEDEATFGYTVVKFRDELKARLAKQKKPLKK